jgi:hypothetical protein
VKCTPGSLSPARTSHCHPAFLNTTATSSRAGSTTAVRHRAQSVSNLSRSRNRSCSACCRFSNSAIALSSASWTSFLIILSFNSRLFSRLAIRRLLLVLLSTASRAESACAASIGNSHGGTLSLNPEWPDENRTEIRFLPCAFINAKNAGCH